MNVILDSLAYHQDGNSFGKWDRFDGLMQATGGRFGGRCAYLGNATAISKTVPATRRTYTIGYAIKPGGGIHFAFLRNEDMDQQGIVAINANGSISYVRGSYDEVCRTDYRLRMGYWQYVEALVTIGTTDGRVRIQVDGDPKLDLAGLNTQWYAKPDIAQIMLGYPGNCWIQDIYINDDQGPAPWNGMVGDIRVLPVGVTGNGFTNQWTPSAGQNFECVNEDPVNPATFTESSALLAKEYFQHAPADPLNTQILGVQLCSIAAKSDAGIRAIRQGARVGGAEYESADKALLTDMTTFTEFFPTNPATGLPWTKEQFDAAQIGARLGL
jgi:hypothetical protein